MTEHRVSLAQLREAIRGVEAGGHSVFAPSSSKMWLFCAGSLIPNIFAEDDSGEDAAWGTVSHSVAEDWLKSGKKPKHRLGETVWIENGGWEYPILIDEMMLDVVERYVMWVRFLPGQHFIETRVDFSDITPIPNQGGTADFAACMPGRLVIADYKGGKGIHVYAKDNTQALLYAYGFFQAWDWFYDFQEIEIRIAQPRRDNMDVWTVSRKFLLAFADWAKTRAHAAWVQNAPRSPSVGACEWCKVQATCGAKAKVLVDLAGGTIDDLSEMVGEEAVAELKVKLNGRKPLEIANELTLTTFELEKLLEWRGSVEKFFSKVNDELFKRANRGEQLKLQKMVEGRTFRAFRSRPQTVKRLLSLGLKQSDFLTEELASPSQVEELLKKAGYRWSEIKGSRDEPGLLDSLVMRPPGKATLAPLKDPRPALGARDDGVFSDITQTTETEEI